MWNSSESPTEVTETAPIQPLVSLELRDTLLGVINIPNLVVAIAGILTNTLNMLAFHRMGFHNTTNISFFSLAIADFTCEWLYASVAVLRLNISGVIDLGVDFTDAQYLFAPVILGVSTLGSWVTAIISVERCCCIVFPVTVKKVFTPKTTLRFIVGMLLFQIANIATNLTTVALALYRPPNSDRPQILIDRSKIDKELYIGLNLWASSFITFICFGIIVASTTFLVIALRQRQRWLQAQPHLQNGIIERDKKLVRTVAAISVIYIICYLPGFITVLTSFAIPGMNPLNRGTENLSFIQASYVSLFQSLSQMINLFIYFKLSSSFNRCLKELLCLTATERRTPS